LLGFGGSKGRRGLQGWWDLRGFGKVVTGAMWAFSAPEDSLHSCPGYEEKQLCLESWVVRARREAAAHLKNKVFCSCGVGGKSHLWDSCSKRLYR